MEGRGSRSLHDLEAIKKQCFYLGRACNSTSTGQRLACLMSGKRCEITHMWTLVDFDVCLNSDWLPHFASVWHFLCQEAYPETAYPLRSPPDRLEAPLQVGRKVSRFLPIIHWRLSLPSLPQLCLCFKSPNFPRQLMKLESLRAPPYPPWHK